jgi:hypothetical protein
MVVLVTVKFSPDGRAAGGSIVPPGSKPPAVTLAVAEKPAGTPAAKAAA